MSNDGEDGNKFIKYKQTSHRRVHLPCLVQVSLVELKNMLQREINCRMNVLQINNNCSSLNSKKTNVLCLLSLISFISYSIHFGHILCKYYRFEQMPSYNWLDYHSYLRLLNKHYQLKHKKRRIKFKGRLRVAILPTDNKGSVTPSRHTRMYFSTSPATDFCTAFFSFSLNDLREKVGIIRSLFSSLDKSTLFASCSRGVDFYVVHVICSKLFWASGIEEKR